MKIPTWFGKHPVNPPTEEEIKTSKGTLKEDFRPYKDEHGTWIYPKGYSKQKKYTRRRKNK